MRTRVAVAVLILPFWLAIPAAASEHEPSCGDAASWAEREWGVPAAIVDAIGRVESGRANPVTGHVSPWPWTVNSGGYGYFFASRGQAIGFVRALWAQGVRRIDVGCFQVDLFYHPVAFNTLEQAFDPMANADYAARYLSVLREQTGSWTAAVASYHSRMPQEGDSYRRRVLLAWRQVDEESKPPRRPAERDSGGSAAGGRFEAAMSASAHAIALIRPARNVPLVTESR